MYAGVMEVALSLATNSRISSGNGNQEVDYLQNFRILQSEFAKHKIDKPIPVQKLAKLTLAPNLEFLQWLRKFWVQRFPDDKHYDAAGRRGGVGAEGAAPAAIAGVTRMESASSVHTVVGQDSESASHPPASKETKRPAKPSLPLATKGSSSGTPLGL